MSSGPLIHEGDLPEIITRQPGSSFFPGESRIMPIAELERRAILNTISQLRGDKLPAAKLLGIGKTTLYRKLREYAGQGALLDGKALLPYHGLSRQEAQ